MYCTSVRLRPRTGTGSDSPALAWCGEALSDCGRLWPGAYIGSIRPAAAKSLCKNRLATGSGISSLSQMSCTACLVSQCMIQCSKRGSFYTISLAQAANGLISVSSLLSGELGGESCIPNPQSPVAPRIFIVNQDRPNSKTWLLCKQANQ